MTTRDSQILASPAHSPSGVSARSSVDSSSTADTSMAPNIDYDLDVEGDVILTLQNPNAPFAHAEDEGSEPEQSTGSKGEDHQVLFRLSSRHLISASPYFRAMLTGPWRENTSRSDDSLYTLDASDWDEEAFQILMNILHGNFKDLTQSVDLELLGKIAVLVDYYKCHDAVTIYAELWMTGLRKEKYVAEDQCRDLALWLFVSYVFNEGHTFHETTLQAMQQTRGPLRTFNLPIPGYIIGM
ncbi:hypothetical protein Daus18300_011618 [Diaporthe australafricana]|uniref:BTB domain-containing protein n=1 Tax=Diaporthe australafricana TaxID=127596 RepID=A0ABR3W648_9PEZI